MIDTVEDLYAWVVEQLTWDRNNKRYLPIKGETWIGSPGAWLSRTERTPWSRQKERKDQVAISLPLYEQLVARWPVSERTGGRTNQTPTGILQLTSGAAAVERARREAKQRRATIDARSSRRWKVEDQARQVFAEWEDANRWLYAPSPELDGRTPIGAAEESEEGMAATLAFLQAGRCPECGTYRDSHAGAYDCPPNTVHAYPVRWVPEAGIT